MSKAVQYLGILYNNPFIFGPIFHSFYKSLLGKDNDILLSYLVLPLVLYPESQIYLTKKRHPQSSLRILTKEHRRMYGFQERIYEFRNITNISLQHAADNGILEINESLSVEILSDWPEGFISPPKAREAARRLGEFMSPFDVPTVYRMLGVKKL